MSTSVYGFTPTNAVIVGTRGTVRFGSEFNLPGPFEVISADHGTVLTYEEPAGRHFEGLYFEAAEVARCIKAGQAETRCRPLQASLDTMEPMDMIQAAAGIDFVGAELA